MWTAILCAEDNVQDWLRDCGMSDNMNQAFSLQRELATTTQGVALG
jgi:hypothetical protein